jgi:hypothetical protein
MIVTTMTVTGSASGKSPLALHPTARRVPVLTIMIAMRLSRLCNVHERELHNTLSHQRIETLLGRSLLGAFNILLAAELHRSVAPEPPWPRRGKHLRSLLRHRQRTRRCGDK